MYRSTFILAIAVLFLTVLSPCVSAEIPDGTQEVLGESDGALYALYHPPSWNGDLVLYAHGHVYLDQPIQLPQGFAPTRDGLLELGYAVAYSSFSKNGWAVKEGFKETRQLRTIFAEWFQMPNNIYVMGHSMGGLIAVMLAEKHPSLFAGAVPMCGVIGGSQMGIDYKYDIRVLFDYFYPDVLPGNALEVPEDFDCYDGTAFFVAVYTNPGALYELAGIDQVEIPYASFDELVWSVMMNIWGHCMGCNGYLELMNNHIFYDNSATYYTGSMDDEALNAGVDRFEGHPAGHNYLRRYYQPTGRLNIPALTLHTSGDGVVHPTHQAAYAAIVAAQDNLDQLVQREFDRFDHCTFTTEEEIEALLDVVDWVETGVPPTP